MDSAHGHGVVTLPDGKVFEGDFSNDYPVAGQMIEANGDTFRASFDGATYVSEWRPQTKELVGAFENGWRGDDNSDLLREFTWTDGRRFVGRCKRYCPLVGALTDANGAQYAVAYGGHTLFVEDPIPINKIRLKHETRTIVWKQENLSQSHSLSKQEILSQSHSRSQQTVPNNSKVDASTCTESAKPQGPETLTGVIYACRLRLALNMAIRLLHRLRETAFRSLAANASRNRRRFNLVHKAWHGSCQRASIHSFGIWKAACQRRERLLAQACRAAGRHHCRTASAAMLAWAGTVQEQRRRVVLVQQVLGRVQSKALSKGSSSPARRWRRASGLAFCQAT